MSRDGLLPAAFSRVHRVHRTPHVSTWVAGLAVGIPAGIWDIGTFADLSNIGTLFAFALVCLGVMVLRRTDPDRPRPFRVPMVYVVAPLGAVLCVFVMKGLPTLAWIRFGWWLAVGLVLYFAYGFRNSRLRRRDG
jgi:APA family basic amino acid/polyamine antiporter